ncbi:MAG TPA: pyruvate kinase [bacterium]|nr:pyruvate kinase [bacterium]
MPNVRTSNRRACSRAQDKCVVKLSGPVRDHPLAIICTVGPSVSLTAPRRDGKYSDPRAHTDIAVLVDNGMAAARINFSHVKKAGFGRVERLIAAIRAVERQKRRPIPIIMDLEGPKIRIRRVFLLEGRRQTQVDSVDVARGDRVEVSSAPPGQPMTAGVKVRLNVSYPKNLLAEVNVGDPVVVGDSDVFLQVESKAATAAFNCIAQHKGKLAVGKGVDLPDAPGGRLAAGPKDVAEDREALRHGFDVDLVAQSFVQGGGDVDDLCDMMTENPRGPRPIIAKIESRLGYERVDEILSRDAVFGLMVARGDLGNMVAYDEIPKVQKGLIDKANVAGKPVIVATQLLESMMRRPRPHRSEPQDIATAIEEGADALMLSGETAAGDFPLESVQVMARVIAASVPIDRRRYLEKFGGTYSKEPTDRIINVLGYPICELAEVANSPFIMSYATTGISATMISRFRPKMSILALTPNVETARLLRLLYNVCPVLVDAGGADLPRRPEDAVRFCRAVVEELGLVGEFDLPGRHIALTLQPRIPNVRSRSVIVFRW